MRIVMIAGAAATLALAPQTSEAACSKRTTGTVVGAVAGGLLGNAVASRGARTEGALLGAAVGGFAGNQLTKCKRPPPRRYSSAGVSRQSSHLAERRSVSCRYESRIYYDGYGRPVEAPARVCG